jgi:signal transduction histidine kinase
VQLDRTLGLVELVEPEALQDVCAAFQGLFGIPMRVLASDGTLVSGTTQEETLCAYLRQSGEANRRCIEFRNELKRHAPETGRTTVRCFAGCAYHVAPVLHDGDVVGKVVYGPYLEAEIESLPSVLLRIVPQVHRATLAEAAAGLRRVRQDALDRIVQAFTRLLDLILYSGHRAALISDAHVAAIQESYRDLAEKNRMLQETTERLQELDRLKSNFLATVSHELRTPLTSIIGYSEMLAQGLAGEMAEEQRKFARTILERGEHLLRLISAILDISTLDAGRLSMHREPVDIAALCARTAEKVHAQSGRHDVRLNHRVAEGIPPVHADPGLVEKALGHLIDNAVKFSPPSAAVDIDVGIVEPRAEGKSAVGFVLLAPTRRFVQVSVRDAGPGIPESEIDRIFEPFYQVDGSATRSHGGLGLGLTLVRQFAHAHGGEVKVESAPGRGAVFRFLLPLPPARASLPPPAGAPA